MGLFVFTSRSARLWILTLLASKTLKLSIQKYIGSKQVVSLLCFSYLSLSAVLITCVTVDKYKYKTMKIGESLFIITFIIIITIAIQQFQLFWKKPILTRA